MQQDLHGQDLGCPGRFRPCCLNGHGAALGLGKLPLFGQFFERGRWCWHTGPNKKNRVKHGKNETIEVICLTKSVLSLNARASSLFYCDGLGSCLLVYLFASVPLRCVFHGLSS